ncbi:MAG: NnrU family protein [Candidatus Sedimenticola sp. PURPLELP]
MTLIVIGLVFWIGVHLFPSLMPATRSRLIARFGEMPYQGLFALLILFGLACIVFGWRGSEATEIYTPPEAATAPALLLIMLGFILIVAANFPSTRVKRWLRHPQLSGVLLWAVAHLLLNGDNRSVVVFGALAAWTLVSMITINRREGEWEKPEKIMPMATEVTVPVTGVIVMLLFAWLHPYLSGISLMAN